MRISFRKYSDIKNVLKDMREDRRSPKSDREKLVNFLEANKSSDVMLILEFPNDGNPEPETKYLGKFKGATENLSGINFENGQFFTDDLMPYFEIDDHEEGENILLTLTER